MSTATVILKRNRLRPGLARHPWVYPDAILRVEGDYENGDRVLVRGPGGEYVGEGFINDRSRLKVRIVTFAKDEELNDDLLRKRAREAIELRENVLQLGNQGNAYRIVHSEADGLPGLIIDRYADQLVIQCTALALSTRLDPILDELEAAYEPKGIFERGQAKGLRAREGLGDGRGVLRGSEPDDRTEILEGGLRYRVDLRGGQKTGFFLDQRDNRRRTAELSRDRHVLDACTFTGSFALSALVTGKARSVRAFDASRLAIEQACEHATLNGVEGFEPYRADAFNELKRLGEAEERFGIVILDPPKFAHGRADVSRALAGLLELNTRAMRLLDHGGILVTCSCSHHVGEGPFEEVLREAARRARRDVSILERRGAGPDHPSGLHCPEGRYLSCWFLRAS